MNSLKDEEEQILQGTVNKVVFFNPENGYAVLQLTVATMSEPITIVGTCARAKADIHLVVRGTFQEHPKFGKQFKASSVVEAPPSSASGIEKYLASGVIKGVGPKTAARLINKFGTKTLEIIANDPELAAQESGISAKKAQIICNEINQQHAMGEIIRFLIEHQISPNLARQIYDRYKNRSLEVLTRDPYILARQMRGVGFQTADRIAMQLGLAADAPQRLKASLYYSLERALEDGHCFLPKEVLFLKAQALLDLQDITLLEPHLVSLTDEGFISIEKDEVALLHLDRAETFVAEFIARRASDNTEYHALSEQTVNHSLKLAAKQLNITLSDEQTEAVRTASQKALMIITGGPGCGKTTIIRALTIMFKSAKLRLALVAPTGRAAQRMAQVCDHPASTIHRLLRYNPKTHSFLYGPNQPLEVDAVIIDETSMLDILLAKDIFSAIPKHARIILVGDRDQLPSVGPGRVFSDILSIPAVKTISLSRLFRRADVSAITTVAMEINDGTYPIIAEPDGCTKSDAYFISRNDPEECAALVESLVADQIPRKFGFKSDNIMVLTPSNRGHLGTIALNERLQARLNPPGQIDSEQELDLGTIKLRVGDRVCQRVNNYQIDPNGPGVFNGDPGVVKTIDHQTKTVTVKMWDKRLIKYPFATIHQLALAYAISVHRSQGSEIPCVVLTLHNSHYMLLERQLVYTAITRAKKLLIIVGSKRALQMATKRTSGKTRYCRLQERILENL